MVTKKNKMPVDGNLDLGFSTKKKRFSVNGDINNIIEFDPTDIGVANRLSKAMPKFKELTKKWEQLHTDSESIQKFNEENLNELNDKDVDEFVSKTDNFSKQFDDVENTIKQIIDEVFDSNVADALLGNSSAFSPVNGYFKFEHIITALLNCYEQNVQDEAPKFDKRKVHKYTNKYIKR